MRRWHVSERMLCVFVAATMIPGCRELHLSRAARVTITEGGHALQHLRLVALAEEVIDDEVIDAILGLTDTLLDKGDHFKSTWDLRECKVPRMAVVGKCIRWALKRKNKLDECNQRMAVCMPNRPALLTVVRIVLKVFGPVCPVLVSEDEAACETFMTA